MPSMPPKRSNDSMPFPSKMAREESAMEIDEIPQTHNETMGEEDDEEVGMGEMEDPYGDDLEEEGQSNKPDENSDEEFEPMVQPEDDEDPEERLDPSVEVYLPGRKLEEGERLEMDNSAYDMHHGFTVNWPCLSFDVIPDPLGDNRTKYPMTTYLVAGTQADKPKNNEVLVMKVSQLRKTKYDDDDVDDNGSDNEDDGADIDPILEHKSIPHMGGINRVRVHAPQPGITLAATWGDTGKVSIYDLQPVLGAIDQPGSISLKPNQLKPLHVVEVHGKSEGYAMDWSSLTPGKLLTGDIRHRIHLTTLLESGGIQPDLVPYAGHTESVEDLQWSPSEKSVFASCSSDQTVRIWDIRTKKRSALGIRAHTADVNVISWNRPVNYLLASGSDDGSFAVWDLRTFSSNNNINEVNKNSVAQFKWHTQPITSIEWHPTEESVLGVSGADDQVTLWDLSVEPDTEDPNHVNLQQLNGSDVPPQLLFIHQGQTNVKELHWHRQIPGCMVTTAASGFNVFKTISI